ncbi:MAG: AraC family transcriptional regulator [Bacteroidota bacterium]
MALQEAYENQTFEALALRCGFRSKSSFNRIFKKHTGVSPSEYLKGNKPVESR